MTVPMRDTPGVALDDLRAIVNQSEDELPSFFWSILPVILPILLISLASAFAAGPLPADQRPIWHAMIAFAGNRNVALLIGAAIAIGVLMRQRRITLARVNEMIGPPLATAGVIILITSAGGAFGLMLKNAGVGEAVKQAAAGHNVNLVLLA